MKIPRSEEEKAFCQLILEGKDGKSSAIAAGYSPNNAASRGYELRKRFADYLAKEAMCRLRGDASVAIKVLRGLAIGAVGEGVRLKAAEAILRFGGFNPVDRKEITVEHKTEAEVDAQLKALLGDKAEEILSLRVIN